MMHILSRTLLKTLAAWAGALMLASSAHAALVWSIMHYTHIETPPALLSSFEVVELSASVAAREPEVKPEIEPEPASEPEILTQTLAAPDAKVIAPEPEIEPAPVVQKKPEPKNIPLAKVKLKPKPKPKLVPKAKAVQAPKLESKPEPTVKPVTPRPPLSKPVFKGTQDLAAATAFVAPSQHAAYLNNPKPVYPTKARKRGMEGRVVLRVTVRRDGKVKSIEVEQGSGFSLLDRAARTAVLRWRFQPAKRSGVAVEGVVLVPFDFRLMSG